MKQYSSNRAQKGKLAYRTPDRFIYKKVLAGQRFKQNSKQRFDKKSL